MFTMLMSRQRMMVQIHYPMFNPLRLQSRMSLNQAHRQHLLQHLRQAQHLAHHPLLQEQLKKLLMVQTLNKRLRE